MNKGIDVDFKANVRTADRWILEMEKDLVITEKKPFKSGNYGAIYHGKLLPENKDVAVKKMSAGKKDIGRLDDLNSYVNGKKKKSWSDEIEAIKTLQHENIVFLHG